MDENSGLRAFNGVGRLFPLPDVVLFPHAVLPLHIFEPRYRQLTRDALESDQLITMVQVKRGGVHSPGSQPLLEDVGCMGVIINHERLPDGRFNLLLAGETRVRLVGEVRRPTLYRQAWLKAIESVPPPGDHERELRELVELFHAFAEPRGGVDRELSELLRSGIPPASLTDLLGHALPLSTALKQQLLDEADVANRIATLRRELSQLTSAEFQVRKRPRSYPPPVSLN